MSSGSGGRVPGYSMWSYFHETIIFDVKLLWSYFHSETIIFDPLICFGEKVPGYIMWSCNSFTRLLSRLICIFWNAILPSQHETREGWHILRNPFLSRILVERYTHILQVIQKWPVHLYYSRCPFGLVPDQKYSELIKTKIWISSLLHNFRPGFFFCNALKQKVGTILTIRVM